MARENKEPDDNQSSLEDFFGTEDSVPVIQESAQPQVTKVPDEELSTPADNREQEDVESPDEELADDIEASAPLDLPNSGKHIGYREAPKNLDASLLLSVDYVGGSKKKAILRLYNPSTKKLYFWYDNTGHQPYCYSNLPPQVVQEKVKSNRGYVGSQVVELQDLLRDEKRVMTKVIAADPLSIGGTGGAIRDLLTEKVGNETVSHAWEAAIRYRNCYSYDYNLVPGLMYKIENGNLVPCPPDLDETVLSEFKKVIQEDDSLDRIITEYAPMFFTEVPDIKRLAIDIEVMTPAPNRMPDINTAPEIVTAIGLSGSDGFNKCLVLKRKGHKAGPKAKDFPKELEIIYFDDEKEMLVQAFQVLDSYPLIFTFVGDAFDLTYLYRRAERLGVNMDQQCPFRLGKDIAIMKGGLHIDLYRFLKNPSIRLYALSGAYERSNLDSIAQGLLGIGKLELSTAISDLPYHELAHYCWIDANITLQITQYNENLLLRLMILLMRISRLSIDDVTRFGISSWIQSLFRQEHRSRGILIPQQAEIKALKSIDAQTAATIKDKAFKGAIVIDPVAGVHFNATVLDFASLYPTIMKKHNISYETVDCPHDICRNATDNRVPETEHWTCKLNKGMISQTIGFFRDTRVKWFKGRSKDKTLDEQTRNWSVVVEKALKVYINACLPYHEEIVIRNQEGIICKRKIGTIEQEWKGKEVLSICNDFSSDQFGASIFVPIIGFRKSGNAKILKIQLHDGRIFQCTPNHVVPTLIRRPSRSKSRIGLESEFSIEEEFAEDLELNDELLILGNGQLSTKPPNEIFIPDSIESQNLTIGMKRADFKRIAYKFGQSTDSELIQMMNKEFRYAKGSKVYKARWNKLSNRAKDIIRRDAGTVIPMYVKMTRNTGLYKEAGKWQNIVQPLSDEFFAFLGWYISEGTAGVNRMSISQYLHVHPQNYAAICSIITTMGWPCATYSDKDIVVHSNVLTAVVETLCGKGSKNKRIPIDLLDLRRAKILLDAYFEGDGNFNIRGNKRYSTSSEQLARDLVFLLGTQGKYVSIHSEPEMYRIVETKGHKYRRKYHGSINFSGTYPVRIKSIESIETEVPVFDIETGNGWFTTTNGIVVHNSYGVTGAQHFELFCLPAAESVTAYGRHAILQTKEKAEAMGVRVLYGDTDSVFLDNPSQAQQDEIVQWSTEALGIDLEVEKTYKYVALSDRKKNYIGVYQSGYVEVKGLSGKKRNTPRFI
ncbi:MAG: DNA polymerase domain-containing protein, partial [Candidatus Thorarchaeota archaeon]